MLLPKIFSMFCLLRKKLDWFSATRIAANYLSTFCTVFYWAKDGIIKITMGTNFLVSRSFVMISVVRGTNKKKLVKPKLLLN